ncbi:MAG: ABC transporter ATP-binding protein [Tannerellaceae bacterium]|nr:ABC transporter ATP-binding protein [Tannerellaceae bacterium]
MIEIQNLSFHYHRSRPVFEDVSFRMTHGIYGLLGENGVGKTTLLHIIGGLLFPKSGECRVAGYPSYTRNPEMLKKMFFLPEEFQAPAVSVSELAAYNSVFYPNFSQEDFRIYLEKLHVEGDRKISELSAGQKKKAMIAYGLALNVDYTLLDEPTNGLDIPSKSQFRQLLSYVSSMDKCIIISTHQVRDLAHLIDPVIILDRNQVLLNNTVEEITQKLLFAQTTYEPENVMFTEQNLYGYASVTLNTFHEESVLDIETLFNAVMNDKETFRKLFNA